VTAEDHERLSGKNLEWRKGHRDAQRFTYREAPHMPLPKTPDLRSKLRKQTDSASKRLDALLTPMTMICVSMSIVDIFERQFHVFDIGNGSWEDCVVGAFVCCTLSNRKAIVYRRDYINASNWEGEFELLRDVMFDTVRSIMRENEITFAHLHTLRLSGCVGPIGVKRIAKKKSSGEESVSRRDVKVEMIVSEQKEFAYEHSMGEPAQQQHALWTDAFGCRSKGSGPVAGNGKRDYKKVEYDPEPYEADNNADNDPSSESSTMSSDSESESETTNHEPNNVVMTAEGKAVSRAQNRTLAEMLLLRTTVSSEKETSERESDRCWEPFRDGTCPSPLKLSCDPHAVTFFRRKTGRGAGLVETGRVTSVSLPVAGSAVDAQLTVQWLDWIISGVDSHGRSIQTLVDHGDEMPESYRDLDPELPNVRLDQVDASGKPQGLRWALRYIQDCDERECTLCRGNTEDVDDDDDDTECPWCGTYWHASCISEAQAICDLSMRERGVIITNKSSVSGASSSGSDCTHTSSSSSSSSSSSASGSSNGTSGSCVGGIGSGASSSASSSSQGAGGRGPKGKPCPLCEYHSMRDD